jgi:hypothetical protein
MTVDLDTEFVDVDVDAALVVAADQLGVVVLGTETPYELAASVARAAAGLLELRARRRPGVDEARRLGRAALELASLAPRR